MLFSYVLAAIIIGSGIAVIISAIVEGVKNHKKEEAKNGKKE